MSVDKRVEARQAVAALKHCGVKRPLVSLTGMVMLDPQDAQRVAKGIKKASRIVQESRGWMARLAKERDQYREKISELEDFITNFLTGGAGV